MEMNGEYFCIDDGSAATEEEIKNLKTRHEISKEKLIKNQKKYKEEIEKWKEKYYPIMKDFFVDYEDEDLEYYQDDEDLIYRLSTCIFDNLEADVYYPNLNFQENKFKEDIKENKIDIINKIRKFFPEHCDNAITGFLEGNHDT